MQKGNLVELKTIPVNWVWSAAGRYFRCGVCGYIPHVEHYVYDLAIMPDQCPNCRSKMINYKN